MCFCLSLLCILCRLPVCFIFYWYGSLWSETNKLIDWLIDRCSSVKYWVDPYAAYRPSRVTFSRFKFTDLLHLLTFAAAYRAEKVLWLSASVCLSVRRATTARRISLGGKGSQCSLVIFVGLCEALSVYLCFCITFVWLNLVFLGSEGGSQKATTVVLLVISSHGPKIPKAFGA